MAAKIVEMIADVRVHASVHENQEVWSYVNEVFDNEDIEDMIRGCSTLEQALTEVEARCIKYWISEQDDWYPHQ